MPGDIATLKICDDISTRRVSDDARPSVRPAEASKNDIAEQDTVRLGYALFSRKLIAKIPSKFSQIGIPKQDLCFPKCFRAISVLHNVSGDTPNFHYLPSRYRGRTLGDMDTSESIGSTPTTFN